MKDSVKTNCMKYSKFHTVRKCDTEFCFLLLQTAAKLALLKHT